MMQVRKTFKYRLYHNRRNKILSQRIDCAGLAWNHLVALQRRYYRLTGQYAGKFTMMRHMARLRKRGGRFAYLQMLGSQALQDICKRHDQAYQRFFAYKKNGGRRVGRPTFKRVKRYRSFTLTQAGWKYENGNKITIQGYTYKFALSRPIKGKVKTVTIKRDGLNRFWIAFSVVQEVEDPVVISTNHIGGFDFGLKTFLTDQDGQAIHSPQFLKAELATIAQLNRALARKVKGSNGWQKAKYKLAKAHDRLANKRNDAHWKLAHELAGQYDMLAFETLNMAAMQRLWGRKVSDLGFSQFLNIQEQVCLKSGKAFVKLDKWQPTTKPCSRCGAVHRLGLADRTFKCHACGLVIDRDHNAAINICVAGASATGLGDVRRVFYPAIPVRPLESQPL